MVQGSHTSEFPQRLAYPVIWDHAPHLGHPEGFLFLDMLSQDEAPPPAILPPLVQVFHLTLSVSLHFTPQNIFWAITLLSCAVLVQDNHRPPKGWKVGEENEAEKNMCSKENFLAPFLHQPPRGIIFSSSLGNINL